MDDESGGAEGSRRRGRASLPRLHLRRRQARVVTPRGRLVADAEACEFVGRALASLATATIDDQMRPPLLLRLQVDRDGLTVHLAPQGGLRLPPAWEPAGESASWRLPVHGGGDPRPGDRVRLSAVVDVLSRDGGRTLVDLAAAPGPIALTGDDTVARDVLLSIGAELAVNPWSAGVSVTMVGLGEDVAAAAPTRVGWSPQLDEALDDLEDEQSVDVQWLAGLGANALVGGSVGPRPGRVHVLLLADPPDDEQVGRAREIVAGGRGGVVLVSVGDHPGARWRWRAGADGSLDLGVLGVSGQARRLTATETAGIAHRDGTVAVDPAPPRSPGRDRTRDLLAVRPAPVEIRLLGPVTVLAPGPVDDTLREVLTELVVAVALHPGGVAVQGLQSMVGPSGAADPPDMAAWLAAAQSWLGPAPSGGPRLVGEGQMWQLTSDVICDVDVLRGAAAAPDAPEHTQQWSEALRLIRGEAFSAIPAGRYRWLAFARAAREARDAGVLVASRAARAARNAGGRDGAIAALGAGLTLVPTSEMLWRELVSLVSDGDDGAAVAEVVDLMNRELTRHGLGGSAEVTSLRRRSGGA